MTQLQAATERIYRLTWHGDLPALVADLREAGRAWREVAGVIEELTGVSVTHETVRFWYGDREGAAA